jgi:hypothetical protein
MVMAASVLDGVGGLVVAGVRHWQLVREKKCVRDSSSTIFLRKQGQLFKAHTIRQYQVHTAKIASFVHM